jgi:hypothetical protein
MARVNRFTFVCDNEERELLTALAKRLHRSQSDALRWLIQGAAEELAKPLPNLAETSGDPPKPEPAETVKESGAGSLPAVPVAGEVRRDAIPA